MNKVLFTTCLVLLSHVTNALYKDDGPVVKLTEANFKKEVLSDKNTMWLIEFYAPWCGHCKSLVPSWEIAAKQLKGVVKVGAVDMTTDENVGRPYGIQGFPTLKFFGNDKDKPVAYDGGRDADSIRQWALSQTTKEVNKRAKSKKSDSGSQKDSGSKKKASEPVTDKDVVVLTDATFDAAVYSSKDIWMVEFYAPWCGHCKKLEPEWNEAATALKGKVRFAKVDCTENQAIAQKFSVQGYPTIKYFDYGEGKTAASAKDFQGGRDASAIQSFANDLLDKADIQPDLHELIKQKVYDEECSGPRICVLAFLPNIYESNAKERQDYLATYMQVAKQNRKQPFVFFWLQAGDQLDLERQLNLGFGYPAVIAVSRGKNVFATMRGSFTKSATTEFLTKVMSGSAPTSNLPAGGMTFKKADKWDGKDAPIIEEEPLDYDIEDL